MQEQDIFGKALYDYFQGIINEPLWLNTSYGTREKMPVDIFFRGEEQLTELERFAMTFCQGHILDVGAGAGASALLFQQYGLHCDALEKSDLACKVMRLRGLPHIIEKEILTFHNGFYDTIWLMMNGIGLAGTLDGLSPLLKHLHCLLKEGGKIILDSSDIRYLYNNDLPEANYFGEIEYQYEYKGKEGEWFPWLYVDQRMLKIKARQEGLTCQIVYENHQDEYLAILNTSRKGKGKGE